jgi:AraC-like DNA-binding protein
MSFVRSSCLSGFPELVAELGGDTEYLLSRCNIDINQIESEEYLFPYRSFSELLELSAAELKCPDFGLRLAKRQDHNILGPVAFIVMSAETVGQAIETVSRYLHHFTPAIHLFIEDLFGVSLACLEIRDKEGDQFPQATEHMVAACYNIIELMMGDDPVAETVWFRHSVISPPEVYEKHFRVPVKFNKGFSGAVLVDGALKKKIPSSNNELYKLVVEYFRFRSDEQPSLSHQSEQEEFGCVVRGIIKKLMPTGSLCRKVVAEQLNMHERSLHRKLKPLGYTYESLLDEIRRKEVELLMRNSDMPMSQVAGLLGYSEQSSFNRAFKQWFGVTPSQYHK